MGIVNVTPDSFSDGGRFIDADYAIAHGQRLVAEGAHILDIGGESTRPGAAPVSPEEELRRVLPVIAGLRSCGVPLSIDTRHSTVMAAALEAGASIVNDVTALTGDPRALDVVAAAQAPVVLMHMQGDPRVMQQQPHYEDVVKEVFAALSQAVARCRQAGLASHQIAVDPGIGFGKTVAHNVALLAHLETFLELGCPLLIGVSRKSLIAKLSANEPPQDRLAGSLAAALAAIERGAQILRVHDVAATAQALAVWQAIARV